MESCKVRFQVDQVRLGCTYTVEVDTYNGYIGVYGQAKVQVLSEFTRKGGWLMYNVLLDNQPMVMGELSYHRAVIYNQPHNSHSI